MLGAYYDGFLFSFVAHSITYVGSCVKKSATIMTTLFTCLCPPYVVHVAYSHIADTELKVVKIYPLV
jgi:hypothetical protein